MKDIKEYFEILGLMPGASIEEVKEAYRDLVKVWHPDRFSHDAKLQNKAQEKLKEINEAYKQIQDFLNNLNSYQKATESGGQQQDSGTEETARSKSQGSQSAGSRGDTNSSEPSPSPPKSSGTPSDIDDRSYSPPLWISTSFAVIALKSAKDLGWPDAMMLSGAGMAICYLIIAAIKRTNSTRKTKKIVTWVNLIACWLIVMALTVIIKDHNNFNAAKAYRNRGVAFLKAAEYRQGLNELNQAIKLKPDYAEAYSARGVAYISLDDYQQAINDCDKAINLKPDLAQAYYYRGYAYSSLGNKQQSDDDYKIAARLGSKEAQDEQATWKAPDISKMPLTLEGDQYSKAWKFTHPNTGKVIETNNPEIYNMFKDHVKGIKEGTRSYEEEPEYIPIDKNQNRIMQSHSVDPKTGETSTVYFDTQTKKPIGQMVNGVWQEFNPDKPKKAPLAPTN